MRWNVILPSFTAATTPSSPGLVRTIPAADLATSVAVETAIPICAWRSAGASFAPSPHIPTVCRLLKFLNQAVLVFRQNAGMDFSVQAYRVSDDSRRRRGI